MPHPCPSKLWAPPEAEVITPISSAQGQAFSDSCLPVAKNIRPGALQLPWLFSLLNSSPWPPVLLHVGCLGG